MNLRALQIFVEVMRHRSFAAVARDQQVAPSSISRTVASLENEIGVRLFQRTTRQLRPTEAALAYFEELEPLVTALERAASLASEASCEPRGVLRIGAAVSFSQVTLVPLLPEFLERYPDLNVELLLSDNVADLVTERIDVA